MTTKFKDISPHLVPLLSECYFNAKKHDLLLDADIPNELVIYFQDFVNKFKDNNMVTPQGETEKRKVVLRVKCLVRLIEAKVDINDQEIIKSLMAAQDYTSNLYPGLFWLQSRRLLTSENFKMLAKAKEHANSVAHGLVMLHDAGVTLTDANALIAAERYAFSMGRLSKAKVDVNHQDLINVLLTAKEHTGVLNFGMIKLHEQNLLTFENIKILVNAKEHAIQVALALFVLNEADISLTKDLEQALIAAEEHAGFMANCFAKLKAAAVNISKQELINSLVAAKEHARVLSDGLDRLVKANILNQDNCMILVNDIEHAWDRAEEIINQNRANNVSANIFFGFVAVLGVAAVAVAFTVLSAATFGVAGVIVAGVGVAATLSGVGFFAKKALDNDQPDPSTQLGLST